MNFSEMQRVLTSKFSQKIKNLAAPLVDHFGVSEVYHYRLSNSGHYVNFGLNAACEEFFYGDLEHIIQTPFFRDPKHFKSGVSPIWSIDNPEFQTVVSELREKFNVNWSLQVMRKNHEGLHAYGFGLKTNSLQAHLAFYNALPLLNRFITKFEQVMAPHLDQIEENQVDMAKALGSKFQESPNPVIPEPILDGPFLKEMGLTPNSPLTARELDLIKHLLNNSPASLIGTRLNLSRRTVEHYIDNLKDKFNCSSKLDLIQVLQTLQSVNYFNRENR